MAAFSFYLLFYFVAFSLLFPANVINGVQNGTLIGAIFDCQSRVGKEERIAMEMAIEDLNNVNKQNQKLIPRVKCSPGEPVHASRAARHLIKKSRVQVILGPHSWQESSAVAEVGQQYDVPILSLSDFMPSWATRRWPFLIQASPSTFKEMKAVADIIKSWEWHRVNVIYEDMDSASSDILNHLYGALQTADVEMNRLVPLPSFATSETLHEELERLKREPCRVFVVHVGLALAERVFGMAKEMKMMEKDYVWISTDSTTSLVHSMNASVVSWMQGVLGVRRYFPDTGQNFKIFHMKFLKRFHQKYPEEKNRDPGIFALMAYDAIWTVGLAINTGNETVVQILRNFEEMNRNGLSGKIQFKDRKLAPVDRFQIINIIGKSYRELGFWSDELGFSTATENTVVYNFSMESLGHVFWPGGPWSTPRGWDLPTISNPLRIGVPNSSLTNKFVKVECDPHTKNYTFSGFSIEVFNKTAQKLKYFLPYQFIPYGGNYTDLVKQVELKKFDAAVGDIAIISSRYDYVEFTHAHTESGVVMVVPVQKRSNGAWLFMKPFTAKMWLLIAFINIYNGFIIWSIERNYHSELKGSFLNQIGTLLWLAFATLFSLHGEKLHSNLSKMATLVWLFVALIITQSYTASLTSMLTVQRMEPKIANIETLKSENAFVGYSKVSFVKGYLEAALHFNPNNLKSFRTPEGYADALRNGEISAAFLEVPVAKLFVAKYCKSFMMAGPPYKVGGYGFAFPKGSLLLRDIDEALLTVFENGELKDLERSLIASEKCIDNQTADSEMESLSPQSFFVLFVFTGSTSSTALAIYYLRSRGKVDNSMGELNGIWMLIIMVMMALKKWRYPYRRSKLCRKVSDLESSRDSPNSSAYEDHESTAYVSTF
ncbi:Glutamate-gated kainate-type ion channel receptor subunit GluR5 [Handroanthus impetiginosus]|uniref:Glutamate receptor n=1 Tax=Handroanthus impetiginosus TaxID=429701 RepID=A0A2G9HTP5_9LAMI|nr:Glutamate-gated kainate-type ion channel receptor subunit GluR5 [Handroanthus impetiginosus]